MTKSVQNLSEILKSIKRQDTPGTLKMQYAHQLMAKECQFPNKHQLILDWACQELVYNNKNNCYPDEMIAKVWQVIEATLEQVSCDDKINTVLLRPTFIEVLVNEFQTTRSDSIFFIKCCQTIYATPEFYRPITMKYEKFVYFLTNALKSIPVVFEKLIKPVEAKSEVTKYPLAIYFELIDTLLRIYLKLQKQQPNFQKVAIGFNEKLLKEVAVWKGVLSKFNEMVAVTWKQIDSKELLVQSLWNRGAMASIKDHLHLYGKDDEVEGNQSRKYAMLDSLFKTIQTCLLKEQSEIVRRSMLEFVPDLFQSFISSSRKEKTIPKHFEFLIFRKFCTAILNTSGPNSRAMIETRQTTDCLNQLLTTFLDFNIFTVNDETVNTERNGQFLQNLVDIVVSPIRLGPHQMVAGSYKCIQSLVEIHQSFVETHMEKIISDVLATRNSPGDDESVDVAKCNLLHVLLEIYSRSRQTKEFVLVVLAAVHTNERKINLDLEFFNRLEEVAFGLPVGQSLSIIQLILGDISRKYLAKELGAENNLAAAENFNGKLDKLTVLAELLSVFLHQIHILPSNGYPGENQRKFLELLKSCLLGLVLFPIDQLQKTNEEQKKVDVFRIAWMFIKMFQSISLYLLDHGLIHSPLLHLLDADLQAMLSLSRGSLSFVGQLTVKDWSLYIQGVILYARQLILTSDYETCHRCIAHVEDLISYFASGADTPGNREMQCVTGAILVKEISWLASLLTADSISSLCKIFLNAILHQIVKHNNMVHVNGKDLEVSQHGSEKLDAVFRKQLSLLTSTYFYDDKAMQDAFSDCMVEHIRKNLDFNDFSVEFENFLQAAHVKREIVEPMVLDKIANQSFMDPKNAVDRKNESLEEEHSLVPEKCDMNLKVSCNAVMKEVLKVFINSSNDMRMEMCKNLQGDEHISSCKGILEVMKMMSFEWLIPTTAAKVLLLTLIIRVKTLSSSQNAKYSNDLSKATFNLLEQFTSSTLVANRMGLWKLIDPVLLLKCVLHMINDFTKTGGEANLPDVAFRCVKNLWLLVLNIKSSKANEGELSQLSSELCCLAEHLWKASSLRSVRILNALFSVTLEAIQGRVIKKHCLSTGSRLTHPIIKQMLSIDLKAVLAKFQKALFDKNRGTVQDNGAVSHDAFCHTLRCYGYAFAICLQMKQSGKDKLFMAMLQSVELDFLIGIATDAIRNELMKIEADVRESALFTLRETVCLEFLSSLLVHHSDCTEAWSLCQIEPMFACLFSILEQKHQNQMDMSNCISYHGIMASFIISTSNDVAHSIMANLCRRLASVLSDSNMLQISLEFFAYLFSMKVDKEKKKELADALATIVYLILDIVTLEGLEGHVTAEAYKCIASLVSFSKDILMPSHASSVLQIVLDPLRVNHKAIWVELLQSRVMLLRVLLLNHTCAMIGSIAVFKSALNLVLLELTMLIKSSEFAVDDVANTCDSIMRLYQGIAGHKEAFSKYARYFVADYLSVVASEAVNECYQKLLSTGMYSLMDICPAADFAHLSATLPEVERELFKDMHKLFTNHHKFQGNA